MTSMPPPQAHAAAQRPQARLDDVRRIVVLRPNALGDYMFALPALAALRAAYPQAHLTLLGRRWHREFLSGRPGGPDEVIALPPVPGVGMAEDADCDAAAIDACVAALQARRWDLAVQLYGGGRYSNPFVRRLGARLAVGLCADDAEPLDRVLPYRLWHNERLRLLEVVALAGAAPAELAPRLALTARDTAELAAAATLSEAPLVVLQPGASDPRRRWPAACFAALGDALAAQGAQVVVNGSADERGLSAAVVGAMRRPALDLGGALGLPGLAALLARAALLVSNDTGPLHLAQALGTPTVGIYWFLNLLVAGPLVSARHAHAFSARTHCPVCGAENVRGGCPHDASFVADVPLEEVLGLAQASLERGAR